MDYLQRIYRTDAERLCASHISNSRPDNGDAVSAEQFSFANQDTLEKIDAQRQENIEAAYNRLRDALCANVPGGAQLWDAHNFFLDLAGQYAKDKEFGTWPGGFCKGRAGAYRVAASHLARIFELQYEAVSA